MAACGRSRNELVVTTFVLEGVDGDPISIDDAAEGWRFGDPPDLRAPTAEELRAGAPELSSAEARQLVELLARYPFVPAIGVDDREALLLELLESSTEDVVAWELSLALEANEADRVGPFLERALRSGLHVARREHVITLLSYLLDHPEARPLVLSVMTTAGATDEAARSIVDELALDREVEWP
jgi:hypothetical protein